MKLFTIRNFVISAICLLCLPVACIEDDCGVGAPGRFQVQSLEIFTGNFHVYERYYNETIPLTSAQDSLALFVKVSEAKLLMSKLNTKSNFVFGNVAYACSPALPIGRSQINSLTIRANDTIRTSDTVYFPNENLNLLFDVYGGYGENLSIDEFRKRQDGAFNHSEWSPTFGLEGESILFLLNDSIYPVQQIEFTVDIEVDNIQSFTLTTEAQDIY